MTLARALSDVRELERSLRDGFTGRLQYDLAEDREVRIDGFAFPEGWHNRSGGRHGSVLIELPESYPEHPPRVYIAEDMRYEGERPQRMAPAQTAGTAEWAPVDLFGSPGSWDPDAHSLETVFERLRAMLDEPTPRAGPDDSTEEP